MKYYYSKRHKGVFHYFKNKKRFYGFRYTYYDSSHKRHEKSLRQFNSLIDASIALDKAKNRIANLKASGNSTLKEWSKQVLSEVHKFDKITTYQSYLHLLKNDILPYLGKYKLIDITPNVYKEHCLYPLIKFKMLSHRSLMLVNSKMQAVMNDAVRNGLIKHNDLQSIRIHGGISKPKKKIMNNMQLLMFHKVLRHESKSTQAIFTILEHTGMRAGELLGLRWCDINIQARTIHIRHTRDYYGLRTPKTRSSKRVIKISQKLNNFIIDYRLYCKTYYDINTQSFVILGKLGKPLVPNIVSVKLNHLLKKAGLTSLLGKFTPHSFRHLFASHMIELGVNPVSVAQMLGHANPDITMKIYAQSAPGQVPDIEKALHHDS